MPTKKSTATPGPSTKRAAAPTRFEAEDTEPDLEMDVDQDGEDEDEEPADDAELLAMVQQLKKKSAKSSARSSARQKALAALHTQSQQVVSVLVQDVNAYIDKIVGDVAEMYDEAVRRDTVNGGAKGWRACNKKAQAARDMVPASEEYDLNSVATAKVEAACLQLEAARARRAKSRRRLLRGVKDEVDAIVEQEKVTADARELIKHYKSLLHH